MLKGAPAPFIVTRKRPISLSSNILDLQGLSSRSSESLSKSAESLSMAPNAPESPAGQTEDFGECGDNGETENLLTPSTTAVNPPTPEPPTWPSPTAPPTPIARPPSHQDDCQEGEDATGGGGSGSGIARTSSTGKKIIRYTCYNNTYTFNILQCPSFLVVSLHRVLLTNSTLSIHPIVDLTHTFLSLELHSTKPSPSS